MAIEIEDRYLNQIKKVAAFPNVANLLLSDEQIKEFCVFPALQDYFLKFPIESAQQYSIGAGNEVILDFPSEDTYGITDIRVTDTGQVVGNGSSFWDLVSYNSLFSTSFRSTAGAYGVSGYNPNSLLQQRNMQRYALKSQQNTYTTVNYRVDQPNRKVYAFSTIGGLLNVKWASKSENFASVTYEKQRDVIKLAQSELLYHLADSADIVTDSALEVTFNTDALKSRAEELRNSVIEEWNQYPDVIMIHAI